MKLFVLFIVLSAFIALVYSYTFTPISNNIGNLGYLPLFLHSQNAQTFAYTATQQGSIYQVDLSNGQTTQIFSNGAPGNCLAVALYVDPATSNPAILYGGEREFYSYSSLTSGGTKSVPYAVQGFNNNAPNIITGSSWFRPNCIVTDSLNSVMYISDKDSPVLSSTQGAIWKLNFASGSAFNTASLSKLSLKVSVNGNNYIPGDPYGMSLVGTTLYFVEEQANKVCKVDVGPTSATYLVVTQIITTGISKPMGIAVDSNNQAFAYVSTWNTPFNSIIKVDLATNSFTTLVSSPSSVTAMIFSGTDIIMTSENDIVKMDLLAPAPPPGPSPPGPSPPGPSPSTPVSSSSSESESSSKSDKDNKLLFLLFLLVLIPTTCCCCYFFVFGGRRKKDKREEVPQEDADKDKKITETELSPPLHYLTESDSKESKVIPVTTTHHYASV